MLLGAAVGHFATFLCRTYKKKDGKHLGQAAPSLCGKIIYQASQRFKHSTRPEPRCVCCALARTAWPLPRFCAALTVLR